MDYEVIIFWLVCSSCLAGLAIALRNLRSAGGWILLYLFILVLAIVGWLSGNTTLIYSAATVWLFFVVLPGLLVRLLDRRVLEQRFRAARRLARIVSWLHPFDGWRQQ